MSLRIRQVKPDFWRDSVVAELSDTARLVYIGLWMEADDAGWFRYEVTAIAADLYPYLPRDRREKLVRDAIAELKKAGRLEFPRISGCHHVLVRNLTRHQRLSSPEKRVHTFAREHERCRPAGPRGSPRFPAGVSGDVTGLGSRSDAPETDPADPNPRGSPRFPAVPRFSPTRNVKGKGREGIGKGGVGGAPDGAALFEIKDGRLTKTGAA